MTAPAWSATDEQTGNLLDLLADDGSVAPSAEDEWREFVGCLRHCAKYNGGTIYPNDLRPLVRGQVKPSRIGAFTRRAILEGLVEYTGQWQVSDDTESGNAGKPCRELRWVAQPTRTGSAAVR